jgi:hypothetical protein
MIHIATVHWATDRWVDVQLHYLEKHVQSPFRVYACLDGIERDLSDRFYYSLSLEQARHPDKLNLLAERITGDSDANDLIVFLDGDAFPIAPFEPAVEVMLAENSLAAIRRDENRGDPQPHPSFCVTTVGFWQDIGGDWSRGQTWLNADGETVDDPGGKLLKALEERGTSWTPSSSAFTAASSTTTVPASESLSAAATSPRFPARPSSRATSAGVPSSTST